MTLSLLFKPSRIAFRFLETVNERQLLHITRSHQAVLSNVFISSVEEDEVSFAELWQWL